MHAAAENRARPAAREVYSWQVSRRRTIAVRRRIAENCARKMPERIHEWRLNVVAGPGVVAALAPGHFAGTGAQANAMHVVQIGPFPPPHGGVQSNIIAIRAHLRAHGARSSVINVTRFRQAEDDDVHHPRNAPALAWLLARLRCDILHLHIGGNLTTRLLALGLLCTWIPGTRTVLTFHSGGFPGSAQGRSMRRRGFAGFVLRRFDRVIAVNDEIAEFFARLGCEAKRVERIRPDAVPALDADASAPDPLPPTTRAFVEAHDPLILSVGGLEPEYDVPLQVELMGRVVRRHPRAGLAIVGAGSLEHDVERMIAARPWGRHVLLCRDVPHKATLRLIAESRVLIRTTHYDGDSIAVREALHIGTPVIASDNGMRPAGVRLVPARDLDALDAAVDEVLATSVPPRREAHVAADDRNIARIAEVYRELVRTPTG